MAYYKYKCGMEKLVSRQAHNLEVAGSSPASATKRKIRIYELIFLKNVSNE